MKTMTRIKLINWHYFSNETISVKDSVLITGENAAGKSTVLDAMQLILTTNTRKFNPAANEKSKRDLRGYVRCKTGEEGNKYVRKNGVISYVALEFYEESKNRYFVIGAKFDSPDEDADIKKNWFCEECSLDDLSFIVDNKPATDEQFKNNGKKVSFIRSAKEAQERFRRRLGNLDKTFSEMLSKSLAFKPMDNVRDFITRFILPERQIDVKSLRENIENLREFQVLVEETKGKIVYLEEILSTNNQMAEIDKDALVIDILLKIADIEDRKNKMAENRTLINAKNQELRSVVSEERIVSDNLRSAEDSLHAIRADISNSEHGKLIDKLQQELEMLTREERRAAASLSVLEAQASKIIHALALIPIPAGIDAPKVRALCNASVLQSERDNAYVHLRNAFDKAEDLLTEKRSNAKQRSENILRQKVVLKEKIDKLKNNKLDYPQNTMKLKDAIKSEFLNRGIDADVRIFADLLEITNPTWQDAVEGYLSSQRFNVLVSPQYYDIAADVYHKLKSQIEGVALVNTQALASTTQQVPENSLASVVTAENSYARAYANYLLSGVVLCDNLTDLKKHSIAITPDCMLYKGRALRKIPHGVYQTPYIGKFALQQQLRLAVVDYEKLQADYEKYAADIDEMTNALNHIKQCSFDVVQEHLSAPTEMQNVKMQIAKAAAELKEVQNSVGVIELHFKEKECAERVSALKDKLDCLKATKINLERDIADAEKAYESHSTQVSSIEAYIDSISKGDREVIKLAQQKFGEHSKTKQPDTIYENYGRRRSVLVNQRKKEFEKLVKLQSGYQVGELGTGEEVMPAYIEEYGKLSKYDLIEYEEKFKKIRNDCETEFRENFLVRMRENIERAQDDFKNLNKSLKNIYYGNDSYRFHYSARPEKRALYDMIMSDINIGGFTLFAEEFASKYHDEMETLFLRLTESDEAGDKVLNEYTDYREYLDYDIEVVSKEGKSQFFSKIYGEKSGGETQTPYYVAIAASFAQLYGTGETARIIMLDEAFDKMDDDRIASMMQFLRSQKFQIILAAPPSKMEVIGEYVDTVLLVYRNGYSSVIEEYCV